jgi:hypothetical protein
VRGKQFLTIKRSSLLENVRQGFRLGHILWNDLGSIWLRTGTSGRLLLNGSIKGGEFFD